uniref:Chondroitin proteoglycan 3 n=1 Tax=Ascaris lumbricoides TaxID=6252 RepID=A0A0M3I2J0_ASCLU
MKCDKLYCFLLLAEFTLVVFAKDMSKKPAQEEAADIKGSKSKDKPASTTKVKCITSKVCFSNDDCNGGSCLGIAVGKCNCGACTSFVACKDDSACGGLVGACNNHTNFCDCDLGFKANGFKSIFNALTDMCNVKDCMPNGESCFGLPCNNGICVCP